MMHLLTAKGASLKITDSNGANAAAYLAFSKDLSHKDALTILNEVFDGSSEKTNNQSCKTPSDAASIYACNLRGKDISWQKKLEIASSCINAQEDFREACQ
jgi:hypothetical protein